jgi:hypothetical protein
MKERPAIKFKVSCTQRCQKTYIAVRIEAATIINIRHSHEMNKLMLMTTTYKAE